MYKKTWSRKGASTTDDYRIIWTRCVDREEPSKVCLLKFHAQQTFLIQYLLVHLHVNYLPLLWSPKVLPSTFSLVFSKVDSFGYLGKLWSFSGSLPHYVIKPLLDFLLVICLMSIQFLGQPEKSRRTEETFFFSDNG